MQNTLTALSPSPAAGAAKKALNADVIVDELWILKVDNDKRCTFTIGIWSSRDHKDRKAGFRKCANALYE